MPERADIVTNPSTRTTESHLLTPSSRVVIEDILPQVDGGAFPVKRTLSETVVVTADIFADGHDRLAAVLKYRYAGPLEAEEWREVPMEDLGNDRWSAVFTVERPGRYEYLVQGWIDRFASWKEELRAKFDAGQDVDSELREGAALLVKTARSAAVVDRLIAAAKALERTGEQATRVAVALAPELAGVMWRHADRRQGTTSEPPLSVVVDPVRARFASWYEMFPRSAGPDPSRSATFAEAAGRLPDIAALGFDVLYLPPIHPIGRTNRKGRNNTLAAGLADPGSPWAIGSEDGGHTAVEPGLGTIDDFDRFVAAAKRLDLDVALDIAFQTSPDHPWVREHPQWFRHRPDGSIKYAENPPKKYQDIYPLDFQSTDWQSLWSALKNVFLFWIGHGVTIFRVDNPHTKPFQFWEWVIREIKQRHPDTIFLSEAFTRPKVMRRLAKLGFSQSYTYFTWRNTKAEIVEYFTELMQTDVREYMRPNLFANTPDILHEYLQTGGPPAFRTRLLLAATLGASYGIYSGFEICENRPLRAGSEEYLDSEKYQLRRWDWHRPGNITNFIARVNRIRRANSALQFDWTLRFHETDNDQLLCYSKRSPDRDYALLVVVNLDPVNMQHGWVQVPLADFHLRPDQAFEVEDLLSGERYSWRGEWNYVRLEPKLVPGHVLRVQTSAEAPDGNGHAAGDPEDGERPRTHARRQETKPRRR